MKPLTPPECDLQDFPFMPLHVARLRDSDQAAEVAPEACWYAVLLWAASWHQIPAASLPDNDAVLTKLIGLGRDVKTFRKHKAGAMRGFVLCDDGRLYHPVVAEQAVESWNRKLQQRWRSECGRIKKRNQRDKTDLPAPTFEAFVSLYLSSPCPEFVPGDGDDCPQGQRVQETGTGTGTGTGTSIVPDTNVSGAKVPDADLDGGAWTTATALLTGQAGMSPESARRFFGRLLSQNGLEARDLFPAITQAMVNRTGDPKAYLTKAASSIAKRRSGEPQKRVAFV